MTWSFTASGHTPSEDPDGTWADKERALADMLGEVVSQFGVTASQFTGNYVTGTPGLEIAEPAAAEVPAIDPVTSASDLAAFRAWQAAGAPVPPAVITVPAPAPAAPVVAP